jgi:hypothetical protein
VIDSNDSNTLMFQSSIYGGGRNLSFAVGDTFEINRVQHALDQPGRTGGSVISGPGPTPPSGWNNQSTVGDYEWNNVRCPSSPPTVNCVGGSTAQVSWVPSQPQILQGVHYFNDTPRPGYTPYLYPHPLTQGVQPPSAPSAPTNFQITRQ